MRINLRLVRRRRRGRPGHNRFYVAYNGIRFARSSEFAALIAQPPALRQALEPQLPALLAVGMELAAADVQRSGVILH